ncbi:MAG: cytochrome c-type biogenesis protein CcmH [Loktanella sp.]|jgi:cytochrome c-type biogenesis protein CcmH|nr:cytochrome c-type biogenesis protein CcmH [Loktanella sp.]MDO7607783.1 cytochrome c-type biogenesis protein CcmH [Loktanella sp.]MDO7622068.1 cytochrome c-type biogenesis protein CcmH [Loktanella sp.]MDO7626562.1 cytochrome c-type biogenesis protein CcmH [Loktanella sp.]MDO7665227.1 cytochrome c-type biogenesis protein CcmH [Loktanella sp.]
MIRLLLLLCTLAAPVWAVEPSEMLDDPVLEARSRTLSEGLRCPICRNESIDESHASLSKDLRIILRERLVAGDTDAEAVDYMVQRYGEFILLNPQVTGVNWLLWGAGPLMLLAALGIGATAIRKRGLATQEGLSDDEEARLKEILRD